MQYNCKSKLDSVPITTSKVCLSHRSYLCMLLISHRDFCSLEENRSTCMAPQEVLKYGQGYLCPRPQVSCSQQDILTLSNNLHFKLKYCHRCLWVVISGCYLEESMREFKKIYSREMSFSHAHHSEYSHTAEGPFKLSVFGAFQSSNSVLFLFLSFNFI